MAKFFEILLSISQTVAIVFSLHIAIQALHASQAQTSAETMLKFSELLAGPPDRQIWIAIEHDKPILKENRGKFTADDLDKYLSDLDSLDNVYDAKVIDESTAESAFSDRVNKTLQCPEVAAYLAKVRKEDDSYFRGIDNLKEHFEDYNREHAH